MTKRNAYTYKVQGRIWVEVTVIASTRAEADDKVSDRAADKLITNDMWPEVESIEHLHTDYGITE